MSNWNAEPHTRAKITILRKYLDAWFPIVSSSFDDREVVYVDGFAGPGTYKNGESGSPVVAMKSAQQAIGQLRESGKWKARAIRCVFVESNPEVHDFLTSELERLSSECPDVRYQVFLREFDSVLAEMQAQALSPFGSSPVFVFVDPFGPTGLSFSSVASILKARSCEVLLHFDADGAGRMIRAIDKGANFASRASLNRVFGDESWTALLDTNSQNATTFDQVTRALVKLYLQRLRSVADYAFPFQMVTPMGRHDSEVGYYLIMATNHALGLEKMKSAMKSVGQDGKYRFSNFLSKQPLLFDAATSKEPDSRLLARAFEGRQDVSWSEIRKFTLNETDLVSPKTMLKLLEDRGQIEVHVLNERFTRKRSTYPDKLHPFLRFSFPRTGGSNGQEIGDRMD